MATRGQGVGVSQRVQAVTLAKWFKKVSELTIRKVVILALLQKKGLLKYGASGGQMRWPIYKEEHQLYGFPDFRPVNRARIHTKDNAYLGWRGYYSPDTITLREKLENSGPEAVIKIFGDREKLMRQSLTRLMNYEMYKDGESADGIANERFHGIESFMDINTGAQVASDVLATTLADSYAGLSTVESALNPTNPQLNRLWSPTIVNSNRNPGGGVLAWEDNAVEYLRAGIIRNKYGNMTGEKLDLITLTQSAYEALLNLLDNKERILVNRGAGEQLVSMGFTDVVEVDGVPVMWDIACPAVDDNSDVVYGYGWTTEMIELHLLGEEKQLFKVKLSFNDSYIADNIFVWCLGNLRFDSPRYFAKWAAIS